jgi:putative transposase
MTEISYSGYRFPPEIIQQAIWLYVRFTLSFRDVEDLLAERGIVVSYETVRRWVNHFGPKIAADLRKRRPKPACGATAPGSYLGHACRGGLGPLPRNVR